MQRELDTKGDQNEINQKEAEMAADEDFRRQRKKTSSGIEGKERPADAGQAFAGSAPPTPPQPLRQHELQQQQQWAQQHMRVRSERSRSRGTTPVQQLRPRADRSGSQATAGAVPAPPACDQRDRPASMPPPAPPAPSRALPPPPVPVMPPPPPVQRLRPRKARSIARSRAAERIRVDANRSARKRTGRDSRSRGLERLKRELPRHGGVQLMPRGARR